MTILLGIDGTGPISNTEYQRDFRHSFVRHIYDHLETTDTRKKQYMRGPSAEGWRMREYIQRGANWIIGIHNEFPDDPIILTGYSRGAAAVVGVAQHMTTHGWRVQSLLLFDCVDRTRASISMRSPRTSIGWFT